MARAVVVSLGCLGIVAGVAAAIVGAGLAREREFQRLIAEGDLAVRERRTLRAIESYGSAIALQPDSMAAHLKRGETHLDHGDLAAALRDLAAAAELDPGATRPWEQLGDVALQLRRHEQAAAHYERYLALDDQNPRVLYKLAFARRRAGDVARSIPILRRATALDPDFHEAHYLLGLCLVEQERLEEARGALRVAVEGAPGLLPAREALVAVHRELGDRQGEIQQLDALAALDPGGAGRQAARALAHARAGRADRALRALDRAAAEHPGAAQVQAALGEVWLGIAEARGDRAALRAALEALRAVPAGEASSATLARLGRALMLAGDPAGARSALQAATTRFPVDAAAFAHLARLEEAAGDLPAARRLRRGFDALTAGPARPAG